MKKRIITLCMILMTAGLLFGCRKKEEPEEPVQPEVVEEPEEPVVEKEDTGKEGMVRSLTTGELIPEEIAKMRPYAIMIGNTLDALPQYNISKADIIYEVPVEGSYTRLMAIFQDITGLTKIGSTRSCRHYFIYFAKEFDAIYVHYGQAVYAEPILAQEDVNNLNGMDSSIETIGFYRDSSRKAPHNAFTSEEGLKEAAKKKGYRTEYADSYEGHYKFADDDAEVRLVEGTDALVVSPGYFVNKPWFVYNKEDGLYYRYEFKEKQMDAEVDKQLAAKNILIQYCSWRNMDENGYLDIDTIPANGKGTGKYITNGKMIDITWTKENENSPARYFDENGEEITINQGKTWVCIVREDYKDRFGVYKTEEELQKARTAE